MDKSSTVQIISFRKDKLKKTFGFTKPEKLTF